MTRRQTVATAVMNIRPFVPNGTLLYQTKSVTTGSAGVVEIVHKLGLDRFLDYYFVNSQSGW